VVYYVNSNLLMHPEVLMLRVIIKNTIKYNV
jgi:hypothetical protein